MAYGSPTAQSDIEPYYTHIRGGRKPSPDELEDLKRRYNAIGDSSPLVRITTSTASRLEKRLRKVGTNVDVYAGMKHSHPFISETMEKMSTSGVSQILAIALAPHYSKMSIGTYQNAVREANRDLDNRFELNFVDKWYDNQVFTGKWAQRIHSAVQKFFVEAHPYYLFTAHSLPERILSWNDPYKAQLLESAKTIASRLSLKEAEYGFAFQSAGRTREAWLGPDILEEVKRLSADGWRNVLLIPVGFVSDHLEILYDIDKEARAQALDLGVRLERTESFNDSDDFIDILESIASRHRLFVSEETALSDAASKDQAPCNTLSCQTT